MQLDRLTIKSQEAVHHAQRLAEQYRHAEVDVEHLALALVEQEEGVVRPLMSRLGVSPELFEDQLKASLAARPTLEGAAAERYLSRALRSALDAAFQIAEKMKDEYVSTEHLFLAAIRQKDSEASKVAARLGLTEDAVLKALQAVRGSQRVTDPSPEDTIAILRGLRERYEVHHGVRIQDGALVAAAKLSHRYISDRFLPDKAIDLMDEAASRLRMEIDSMPTEIDEVQRRIMQLEIEREALKKEKDEASRERLAKLEQTLAGLQEQSKGMKLHWQKEKELIGEIRGLAQALEQFRSQEEAAKREGNLGRAAEIKYGQVPKVEQQIKDAQQKLAKLQKDRRMLKEEVDAEDIAAVVSSWTHIPVSRLLETEKSKLLHMEDRLRQRVVGQDEAITAVSNAVRRARSGLQDPNRPIGSFIFLGPTGVGKTELARALAEFLFDDEHAMVRIDMSEFMEKHTVSRLIGAPPGYVGYEEGGYLTEHVRRKPYSVVLFDEIEKAHPDVFNVLLQILDDGRLTDGQGRTVDFTNTVAIMTSNIGGAVIYETLERNPDLKSDDSAYEQMEGQVLDALRAHFRPEFLNRIDEVIVFHSLSRAQIKQIVDIQVERVKKYLEERNITLELTDEVKGLLAQEGYDPAFGARPLKRVIQRKVLDAMATEILEGRIAEGDRVVADVNPKDPDRIAFKAGGK